MYELNILPDFAAAAAVVCSEYTVKMKAVERTSERENHHKCVAEKRCKDSTRLGIGSELS